MRAQEKNIYKWKKFTNIIKYLLIEIKLHEKNFTEEKRRGKK